MFFFFFEGIQASQLADRNSCCGDDGVWRGWKYGTVVVGEEKKSKMRRETQIKRDNK
jgi:hypothetical protein